MILSKRQVNLWIPKRQATAHKGTSGHLLAWVGSRGMSGAAVLTALGALKGGAGLVTVAIAESERAVLRDVPEALTLPLRETRGAFAAGIPKQLTDYLVKRRVTALALGPGLSVSPVVSRTLKALLRMGLPVVLDADGLNNLQPKDIAGRGRLVLTPHPGEFKKFFQSSVSTAEADRIKKAKAAAQRVRAVVVLKGHHTVITDGRQTWTNPTGNPAMATGGMGDVLTGIIGSLLAQGAAPLEAAGVGVYLHGLAGDLARVSDRGLLARELAAALPAAYRKIGVR